MERRAWLWNNREAAVLLVEGRGRTNGLALLQGGTAILALGARCTDLVGPTPLKNLMANILVSKVPYGDLRAGVLSVLERVLFDVLGVSLASGLLLRRLYPISPPYRLMP